MIGVDRALRRQQELGQPLRVGLVGSGFMGSMVANQIVNHVPGMELVAISNRHVEKARQAYHDAGWAEVREVTTRAEVEDAAAHLRPVVTDDPFLLCQAENIDAIIDATGAIGFGAQVTLEAIEHGTHVLSLNVELDGTVGSILQRRARRAGVVFSSCDGDQPGVEMNLFRFVKGTGMEPLVCGNIKGLHDPHRNPTTQQEFARTWGQQPQMVAGFADGTKISFEQAIVANATGMAVEVRGMRGGDHDGHVDELCHNGRYDLENLRECGGVVDYVVGAIPKPGVFVLATTDDPRQRQYLKLYKLGDGPLYSYYTPYHLCHFEVPFSVARVVLLDDPVLQSLAQPSVDVVATAKVDLKAGQVIDGLGGYLTYGQAENYSVSRNENLLPVGIAEGCELKCAIPADEVLTYDDVILPEGRLIDRLRQEQDEAFALHDLSSITRVLESA